VLRTRPWRISAASVLKVAARDVRCMATYPSSVAEDQSATAVYAAEGPGNDWRVNWSLAVADVPPQARAFRNYNNKFLLQAAKSMESKSVKVADDIVTVEPRLASLYQVETSGFGDLLPSISAEQYKSLFETVTEQLRENDMFVHDGALGSYPAESFGVRSVSDDPAFCLLSNYTLCPAPQRGPVSYQRQPIVVYSLPTMLPQNAAEFGLKPNEAVAVVDTSSGTVLLLGTHCSYSLHQALHHVAAESLLAKDALLIQGQAFLTSNDRCTLFCADYVPFKGDPVKVSPHGHILSQKGLSRCWTSITFPTDSPSAGDYVEKCKDGSVVTRPARTYLPNLSKAPNAIVLVVDDQTKAFAPLSKLSPTQAAFYTVAGYAGTMPSPSLSSALLLKTLAEKHKMQVYLLNTAWANADEAVAKVTAGDVAGGAKDALGLEVAIAGDKPGDASAVIKDLRSRVLPLCHDVPDIGAAAPLA